MLKKQPDCKAGLLFLVVGKAEGLYPRLIVDNFPTFHTVFHNRVENSYFSTTHTGYTVGSKSPIINNI